MNDFNQTQFPWSAFDDDEDLEMQDLQEFKTFYFGNQNEFNGGSTYDLEGEEEMKESELRLLRFEQDQMIKSSFMGNPEDI